MTDPDFIAIAQAHWDKVPDWVQRLAEECQATSQNRAAGRIGRSAAAVSGVLRNKYAGDLGAIEELVRGALMKQLVECPALGELQIDQCAGWRKKARKFEGANRMRREMFHACRKCPHFKERTA